MRSFHVFVTQIRIFSRKYFSNLNVKKLDESKLVRTYYCMYLKIQDIGFSSEDEKLLFKLILASLTKVIF